MSPGSARTHRGLRLVLLLSVPLTALSCDWFARHVINPLRTPSLSPPPLETKDRPHEDQLPNSVVTFPATPPPETTGEHGLLLQRWTPPSCPRLNPKFQSWLMGWPPTLTSFALEATEWTRWWLQLRSEYSSIASALEPPEVRSSHE